MPTVNVVEVARVAPSAPQPEDGPEGSLLLGLSALEVPWIALPLIQRVLIFVDNADADGGVQQLPPFASMVASLRASLAATLARFPPLAGRIVHLPSTADAAIDCSASDGVRFMVAESEDADAARLVGEADHDVGAFRELVPELETGALPAEVLAVQVTRLNGGAAVGVAMHHAVVDGRSVWRFLAAWAAACRGDGDDAVAPAFERAVVAVPGGEELVRSTLRKYSPNLPLTTMIIPGSGPTLPRRTFTVTAQHIHRLKQRITDDLTSSPTPYSSFVALAALTWVSFVRSKHPSAISSSSSSVYLFFFVDCRGRPGIEPPVPESYFGTCISGALAKATARDLLAEDGLAFAAAAVQAEVRRAAEDPLALWDWMELLHWMPLDRLVNVSGSARFPAYEAADFGWGPPGRTELVTMNAGGQLVLVAAKGGAGAVQASVCMEAEHMDCFNSHFLGLTG
ncbi:phenolic glucoside malonyltransferase 1 [Brachypodium distachyon]|uniref:Uncharacterized protein n=1 Tax=Brachypodium distachyon TaxID=15368 RepID=I1I161_BRADI|nr:phenolic glucoside malonyltransferase 1 [Brachypodium distachyon]KQJ95201.1 hypothetical protein BRADI_3g15730v3 [Brachypodium distachyon]|eukprot:XP_003573419.1 phenolic glucoside malonyltransferase 1 [Brachypodium distachyon]